MPPLTSSGTSHVRSAHTYALANHTQKITFEISKGERDSTTGCHMPPDTLSRAALAVWWDSLTTAGHRELEREGRREVGCGMLWEAWRPVRKGALSSWARGCTVIRDVCFLFTRKTQKRPLHPYLGKIKSRSFIKATSLSFLS